MAAYNVEKRDKKGNKAGEWWVVVTPDRRIANHFFHPTRQGADRHCNLLNIYFGGNQ